MATILDLPGEIILHICSFIPSRELIVTVSSVNSRFRDLLYQEWYWRSRYVNCLSGGLNGEVVAGIKMWQIGCIQAEFTVAAATGTAKYIQFKGTVASQLLQECLLH